ncbi:MAG TPA: L-threonylcarbamoyladenylate synthase [Methylibium sp.]|uniref:L-threonylcarbamoyladenylate synthase n=1 Tax=Methylibium sp. TaxID=2067992 RepID=UPI002DBBCE5B|nr:L-threonylcarbamoyladenylate synthase [Methylibium sp.]HEU4458735.1 L-threonylcarbamoyladenylate synthase [Methylibium sp.]
MTLLDGRSAAAVRQAAQAIAAGELVAFATETVYGLGARADDDAAVSKIFAAKSRPSAHPLIVHLAQASGAEAFATVVPPLAQTLVDAFWPGPLTLILPRRPEAALAAAGGQPSIGLRCPSHPVARALLGEAAALGVSGIAAPSANRHGRVSPTRAAHVAAEFGAGLLVLDGGDCELGIESAIVDVSRLDERGPVLLRPGSLGRARLEAAAGCALLDADAGAPRAPGTLASHYAPRATLRLMSAAALRKAFELLPLDAMPKEKRGTLAVYCRSVEPPKRLAQRRMPQDPAACAHELFAVLRAFDDEGAQLLWVEEPPADPAWEGVADRLRRAAAA